MPPEVDLAGEKALAKLLVEAVGLITSAHDVSDGGLAQTLVEASLANNVGCSVRLEGDPFISLYAESAGRAVVTTTDPDALWALAERHGVPLTELGRTGDAFLTIEHQFSLPLDEIRKAWASTLPAAMV
jgi:phosphoribosylformylglycinamidine synthase